MPLGDVFTSPQLTVKSGGPDMGNYYCEHTFFMLQHYAVNTCTTLARDAAGDALVGFMHVPDYEGDMAARHAATAQAVALALRGDLTAASAAVPEGPLRVLLTGFGPFPGVDHNPAGEFVGNADLIAKTVQLAFPGARGCGGTFTISDPRTGAPRILQVQTVTLPVSDSALNDLLPQAITSFSPHAILSLGVSSRLAPTTYVAEVRADDGGLARTPTGYQHGDSAPTESLTNGSLVRAIRVGARALASSG